MTDSNGLGTRRHGVLFTVRQQHQSPLLQVSFDKVSLDVNDNFSLCCRDFRSWNELELFIKRSLEQIPITIGEALQDGKFHFPESLTDPLRIGFKLSTKGSPMQATDMLWRLVDPLEQDLSGFEEPDAACAEFDVSRYIS